MVDLKIHVNIASLQSDFRGCDNLQIAVGVECLFNPLDFTRCIVNLGGDGPRVDLRHEEAIPE